MTSFWVVAGIFIVAALMFVLPTLLRKRQDKIELLEREAANIAIYRDQLAELDNDLRNDILSKEQYEKSKQELQKRMLQDLATSSKNPATSSMIKGQGVVTSVVVIFAVPLTAISLYMVLGDTRGLLPQSQLASVTQSHAQDMAGMPSSHSEIKSVVDNLVARLKENPGDIEGWVMLGRTYAIMGQYQEASATYAKLTEIIPDSAQLLSDYADVLAMTNDGSLIGKPAELINQALKIDPNYPKALALAGTVEFEQKKYDQAAAFWEKLLSVIPADSQLAQSVNESIAQAKSLASEGKDSAPMQLAKNSNIDTDLPVEKNQQSQSDKSDNTAKAATITGTVSLSPALASKVSPNDTVFVFARAKTGPKMPLAILKLTVKDLPTTFTLNDDMAMTPTMKMSSFPEVVIGGRITKSGQAVPASGDLEGFSKPVKLGDKDIAVVIDQVIP
ncbi:c-type cytochrome biogenesis protein CcmI [Nitrosomonas communis]|uniref:Cytochrome c-type biogenesis protein CcmH n=1 Tax=Nitrosomonas communis TaxID=44574 RepID=A0A1H2SJV0_9PROT|nr:c-type cytochrome biogenesis protein CcmI [Nitrosomonas communis]SDW31329.1 cytochrome c-type biogenesis protein CcmH [Nitrosomonas communis]